MLLEEITKNLKNQEEQQRQQQGDQGEEEAGSRQEGSPQKEQTGEEQGEIQIGQPMDEEEEELEAEKLSEEEQRVRTKVRHWGLRWVKVQNIFEWNQDIWVRKWVREAQDDGTILKDRQLVFKCKVSECGKTFHDMSLLKKHQLTHGEKLFVCQIPGCGKKFLDNSKLRRHQLVHTGERPHKCHICGRLFSLDFNLKTHMRTHTGEKPYICKFPGCNRRFTQSSNLSAHEKVHYMKENDPGLLLDDEEELINEDEDEEEQPDEEDDDQIQDVSELDTDKAIPV